MRTRRVAVLVGMAMMLVATQARAQTVTSYTLGIYQQGAAQPQTTTVLQAAGITCGITPKLTVSGTTQNPSKVAFDDPANPATADCVYTDPGTGPLLSLPFGAQLYTAAIAATNSAGTSAYSAQSNPFARPGAIPAIVTGVRVGGL